MAPPTVDELVARVALYPDDLLGIILPASTNPLQVVEAQRFLDQRKSNPSLKPKSSWDDSVEAMLNYPEVLAMMSRDLDWTTALGEAVVADQAEVMEAVQSFRRKVKAAGNLKSDDKLQVSEDQNVIVIQQADPQVIYVPTYQPATVVVSQPYPVYSYGPPYPVYYYPYPPGYTFASGVFWGMTAAWAFNWHSHDIDIDVNRYNNININHNEWNNNWRSGSINNTNINSNTLNKNELNSNTKHWQANKSPADVRSGLSNRGQVSGGNGRPGDANFKPPQHKRSDSGANPKNNGASNPSSLDASRAKTDAQNRQRDLAKPSTSNIKQQRQSGRSYDAFGGTSRSGNQALRDSSRGAASRNRGSFGAGAQAQRGGGGRRR